MKWFFIGIALSVFLISCKRPAERRSKSDGIEEKIDSLIGLMTFEEKIGQMQQLHFSQSVSDSLFNLVRKGQVGSFLNADSLELRNKLQRIAVEESRLGIPLIFGRDVIHGFRTVFPIPLGQSASWNDSLVKAAARIAALEASSQGIDWTFSPMMDIARDPRWGRIAEGCGEDPYLTSIMGIAMLQGYQDDLKNSSSLVACGKHYVGYGAAEGGRDYNTTLIPETELRNVYLPPFKRFIEEGGLTIMSAFNDLNGTPASGNEFTLRQVLRNEWNFNGFVVSDWNSMPEMISHGYCKDEYEVALRSIVAGVDMEMVGNAYYKNLYSLVKNGEITERLINESVRNILRVKFKTGLFDQPFTEVEKQPFLKSVYLETARKLAEESCVLLRNDKNVLPLNERISHIAVIGPLADANLDQLGTWSPDGRPEETRTPLLALKEIYAEKIVYAKGLENSTDKSEKGFSEAVTAANKSQVVILFLGEGALLSGENHSRAYLRLPGAQVKLVENIAATGKPIIVVIMAGRPLILSDIERNADAILYAWHPGTMGGPAIADLISGNKNPSGKLTVSFPRFEGQIPVYYNHRNTGRPASKLNTGITAGDPVNPVNAAAAYLDLDYTPAYPFGYGLSYTTFEYSDLTVSADTISMNDELKVSVVVKNTGKYNGSEIVQLYIHDRYASLTRPVKELKDFKKIALEPGESKRIEFYLTKDKLGFYNQSGQFIIEPGDFEVFAGKNSFDVLNARFYLK